MIFPRQGLYAITQTENRTDDEIIAAVTAVLKGGAAVLQYRDKSVNDNHALARELLRLCQSYQIPFIINDDVVLAEKLGANGVHLGKQDGDVVSARQRLGAQAIIGISCYNSLDRAKTMQDQGADYVAFGRFFPSTSKPLAAPADLETLKIAKQVLTIPIVAIGGILPNNACKLLDSGADVLAVIAGVFRRGGKNGPQQEELAEEPGQRRDACERDHGQGQGRG